MARDMHRARDCLGRLSLVEPIEYFGIPLESAFLVHLRNGPPPALTAKTLPLA